VACERHQRRHGKDGDHWHVGNRVRVFHCLAKESAGIVVTTNAFAVDKGLRRRVDVVLGLERVGFGARCQPVVVDVIAFSLQEVLGLEAVRAHMLVHHHAVQTGAFAWRGRIGGGFGGAGHGGCFWRWARSVRTFAAAFQGKTRRRTGA
jgi:hypothetical protein